MTKRIDMESADDAERYIAGIIEKMAATARAIDEKTGDKTYPEDDRFWKEHAALRMCKETMLLSDYISLQRKMELSIKLNEVRDLLDSPDAGSDPEAMSAMLGLEDA